MEIIGSVVVVWSWMKHKPPPANAIQYDVQEEEVMADGEVNVLTISQR